MAAYRRVYDSRHLQADCQEPGSAKFGTLRSAIEYGLPFYHTYAKTKVKGQLVQKIEWAPPSHGRTRPIALPFPLTRSVNTAVFLTPPV